MTYQSRCLNLDKVAVIVDAAHCQPQWLHHLAYGTYMFAKESSIALQVKATLHQFLKWHGFADMRKQDDKETVGRWRKKQHLLTINQ